MTAKRSRGRPVEKPLPPRTDATAEDLAEAMFSLPADHKWKYPEKTPEYRCKACWQEVSYPDVLTRAGLCPTCS